MMKKVLVCVLCACMMTCAFGCASEKSSKAAQPVQSPKTIAYTTQTLRGSSSSGSGVYIINTAQELKSFYGAPETLSAEVQQELDALIAKYTDVFFEDNYLIMVQTEDAASGEISLEQLENKKLELSILRDSMKAEGDASGCYAIELSRDVAVENTEDILLTNAPTLQTRSGAFRLTNQQLKQLEDILADLPYDPILLCKCLPEYTITTPTGNSYGIGLGEGYARHKGGQVKLTLEQRETIRQIILAAEG